MPFFKPFFRKFSVGGSCFINESRSVSNAQKDLSFYVTVGISYHIRRIRNFLCFSVVQQAYSTQALEVGTLLPLCQQSCPFRAQKSSDLGRIHCKCVLLMSPLAIPLCSLDHPGAAGAIISATRYKLCRLYIPWYKYRAKYL